MAKTQTVPITAEGASLLKRLSIGSGVAGIVLGVVVLFCGIIYPGFAGSDTFTLALIPLCMVVLTSLGNFIYGILAQAAAEEAVEKELLAKRKESHALNVEEDVRFTAERSFRNYNRFAPYVLSILGAVILLGMVWGFHSYWGGRDVKPLPVSSLQSAFVSAFLMLVSAFIGAFFIGQARSSGFRWLRTTGSWLVMTFATFLLAAAGSVLNHFQYPKVDGRFAAVLMVVFLILAAEFIINFVVEFYRPRTMVEERPVFESRFLALFTEPGGVMRNIADMLDYQFGFKVSGTWIYVFIERALYPLVIFWLFLLWISTGIYQVDSNEVGFRVSFGKVEHELLEAGVYFGLPWPFGGMERFSTTEIHTVTVGGHGHEHEEEEEYVDDGHGHAPPPKRDNNRVVRVVTWTNEHSEGGEEDYFVLASRSSAGGADSRAMQVSLAVLDIPVEYRIRRDGVFKFALENADSPAVLKGLAETEVVKYLAGITFDELLTVRRQETSAILRQQIQAAADRCELGVDIIHVDLLGIHPPVREVAPMFEQVLAARENAQTAIYRAESYKAGEVPLAEARAAEITARAKSYTDQAIKSAEAESLRFEAQLKAYSAMPEMFKLRSFLEFMENDIRNIRKYIMTDEIRREEYEFNFELSPTLGLMNSKVGDLTREY